MPVITIKARKGRSLKVIDQWMALVRRETSRLLKCPIENVWVLYEEIAEDCSLYGDFGRSNPKRKKR